MDKIIIKDLEIFAHHGVYAEEKKLGQLFLVSLELFLDLRAAGKTDDLSHTVSYAQVCHEIADLLQRQSFDLIERCAEAAAAHILHRYPAVDSVTVTVKKPQAPIGKPLAYAAVEIERRWHRAYLALGSNMGEKRENLNRALAMLESDDIHVLKVSAYHETAPVSDIPQDDYLNGAATIKTLFTPDELLVFLMDVEARLGRERTLRWGPRTIDLDILLYEQDIIQSDTLTIPHPRMHERLFVLAPLCEIAPNAVHPLFKKRIIELKHYLSSLK